MTKGRTCGNHVCRIREKTEANHVDITRVLSYPSLEPDGSLALLRSEPEQDVWHV